MIEIKISEMSSNGKCKIPINKCDIINLISVKATLGTIAGWDFQENYSTSRSFLLIYQ